MPHIRHKPLIGHKIKNKPGTDPKPPLLNHVVITKILSLKILTFQDIKNFRLVCTLWHNASLDYWCKTAVLKLLPSTKVRAGLSIQDLENRYSSKSNLQKLALKPYSAYQVKCWKPNFDPVHSAVIPAEFSFGTLVASSVVYLHIDQCNFSDSDRLDEIILQCTGLKELVLSGNTYVPKHRNVPAIPEERKLVHLKKFKLDGIMTLGWFQFMLHAPNIESLVFKQTSSYSRDEFGRFLMEHTQLQCRHKLKWPVKFLDLSESFGSYIELATLRYHEFPLEKLIVQFEKYSVAERFKPLLQAVSKTLKSLHIICVSDRVDSPSDNPMDFPCGVKLEMLSELYLWGCVVDNLDFLRFTPNLKLLQVNRNNFEKRHLMTYSKAGKNIPASKDVTRPVAPFVESVDVVQGTVECWNNLTKQPTMWMEALERIFVDCKLGVGSLYTMRRWLPYLKAFGMVFSNSTFLLACEEWPRLEEMGVLYGSLVTDEAVTGGHFLSLKSLQKFTLDAYCNQGWFSDKAVHDGFLKMPRLHCISICVSKQMSTEAERALEDKIARVKIIRNYGNGPHPDYDCCQRIAFNKERKSIYNSAPVQ